MKTVECEPLAVGSAPSFLSALELVVSSHETKSERSESGPNGSARPAPATAIARLTGFSDAGMPLIEVQGSAAPELMTARTIVALTPAQFGCEAVVCFAGGNWGQPIILGLLQSPQALAPAPSEVELNGQRLELNAQEEIVLRCGKSSITLTKAGKVLIRGEYLLSRSAGVNRIKGGSVQIN
jgi:hypothetical protein